VHLVGTFEEQIVACLKVGMFRPKHVDISCMADTISNSCVNDNFVSTYRYFYD